MKKIILPLIVVFLVASCAPNPKSLSLGLDYLDELPLTVYESEKMSPQNMDYDQENKLFVIHPGYYKNKLIHYYKFRLYAPSTYPGKFSMGGENNVHTMPVYVLTTTGDVNGVAEYIFPHYPGGGDEEFYSDFVQVHYVTVTPKEARLIRSAEDVLRNELPVQVSDEYINTPIIPSLSRLQDVDGGVAPINSLRGWYKGKQIEFFTFETTSQDWADFLNPKTRIGDAASPDSGYAMDVIPNMIISKDKVLTAPIWHLNQYFFGVTPGENNGGPAKMGQRNVIDVDRKDDAYSPLWQVFWISKLPFGYNADDVSSSEDITEENGFSVIQTPMFVNCPDIGPYGGSEENEKKAAAFNVMPVGDSVVVRGALVMQAGKELTAVSGGNTVGTSTSGMMGEYSFTIPKTSIVDNSVTVQDEDGNDIAVFDLP